MSKIKKNLEKLYERHRIVVWYDPEEAFEEELNALELPDITVIAIDNDELAVKFRVLKQERDQKFLLYMPYERPEHEENWLLDIELSHALFHTDQVSMLLQELELPHHFQSWLKDQASFFRSKERMNKFRTLATKDDAIDTLNNKLIQVLFNAQQHHLDVLLRDYVKAFTEDKADVFKEALEKHQLADHFWDEVALHYGIENQSGNIYDFLLKLFQYSFAPICGVDQVKGKARVALSNWKDLRSFSRVFELVSARVANDLHLDGVLDTLVLEDVLDEDLFEVIEKRIVRDVIKKVTDRTFDASKVEEIIKKREGKHWYEKYTAFYLATLKAARLMNEVEQIPYDELSEIERGFELYRSSYFKVDQWYRQFITLLRSVEATSILQQLYQEVEKIYSNRWLLNLSERWQRCIERNGAWYTGNKSLRNFYGDVVKAKYVDQKRKVFVIISDALRYEIGEELHRTINQQNRFESTLDYRVTGLPSYTQLGMASLLPNKEITLGEGDDIYVDGLASKGLAARAQVLSKSGQVRATTISAEELNAYKVKSEEAKNLVQNHDVVYVYHDIIDKTGDDKISEAKVFDAVKSEIEHLINLIRRVSSMNVNHIIITADHGFIYQNEVLAESDFSNAEISGDISKSNRRFVIGRNLTHNDAVVKFSALNLGIASDVEILIPKGMNRLRRQGAGSRFIHGGAMLQEVMVPVLTIQKKREDTVRKVDIDIINKSNNRITTNIHPVRFYQTEAVAPRLVGRKIKSYFAVEDDGTRTVISDIFIHNFDFSSARAEEREHLHQFRISTTIQRHSNVRLYLEEQIEGSTQWIDYADYKFSLTLGMTSDFDEY